MTSRSDEPRRRPARNLVTRADGKLVNVARKTGQLFVCAQGCCCNCVEFGADPVPTDLYQREWERRRLRNKVYLTTTACLGPCILANVVMLLFDGRAIWFHSFHTERQVLALYDYIEQMLAAQAYLPQPPAIADYAYSGFDWDERQAGDHEAPPRAIATTEPPCILFLTQADTDLLTLSKAVPLVGEDLLPVKACNLSTFKTAEAMDAFLTAALPPAELIILRLIGGRNSFRDGLDRVARYAQEHNVWLVCMPHTETLDPELTALSTVGVPVTHQAIAYLQYGGVKNYEHLLRFLSDHLLMTGLGYDRPEPQPRHGSYHPDVPSGSLEAWKRRADPAKPTVGVLFYRSHFLSGNTDFVDALVRAGEARGVNVLPVYTYSLKEYPDGDEPPNSDQDVALPSALRYFVEDGHPVVDVVVNTTSFALGSAGLEGTEQSDWSTEVLKLLDLPFIQAVTASSSREQWAESLRGLTPLDTAMNVAIPELDGRIIGVPVSFKEETLPDGTDDATTKLGQMESAVVRYAPQPDRVERIIGMALRQIALRRKANREKRVAFLLTNYNARAGRIGGAVGLDTPASLLRLLQRMQAAGYAISGLPETSDALMDLLIARGTYDLEVLTDAQMATAVARVPAGRYGEWFAGLPEKNRAEMVKQWSVPPGRYYTDDAGTVALAGVAFGNAFVAIQPPRGYGMDPAAIYHMPDLPPPHVYHALYRWLSEPVARGGWGADALVHIGKHGTLEWLPGKGVGIAADCYPDLFLGDLPLIYPFIINDPGEGAQAKRRTHAVIIDHLTPPMTTAEGYGELEELARLADEYYQLEKLDPTKLPLLQEQIWTLIQQVRLDSDLAQILNWDQRGAGRGQPTHTHGWDPESLVDGVPSLITEFEGRDFAHLVENINGYLCELTGAQIRDGLHILGQEPQAGQLVDTLLALVRLANLDVPGLRSGVASCFGLDFDAVLDDLGRPYDQPPAMLQQAVGRELPTHADALEAIDAVCRGLVEGLADAAFSAEQVASVMERVLGDTVIAAGMREVQRTLRFICADLVPNLRRTDEEIANVLHALDGGYVPAGPSGAPTRGMAHVLPTGRNFFTVDPRALPSLAAWHVGQQLADALIERHLRDEGRHPESVGIAIWGTSSMRTHGDDIAQVLALLGVRPRWQAESRRVVGIDVIPLEELGRPRIDVVCRISGFFRDAFPHLITLMDEAFRTVATLDEPPEQNFVRRHQLAERERLTASGLDPDQAATVAAYRIFGSKPGTYGAGILPLIDERNWQDAADFAAAYVAWGGYAYTTDEYGVDARAAFRQVLSTVQVAVKNQDNREHDILDSDDYLQYHGGMIAAIRALSGKNPRRYFGDSADPARAKVRDLKEEVLRVFRTRVVNPKWLDSIRRHGYKGALELAATVDYLFGYDATGDVAEDWMYARLAKTYALDPAMQEFFRQSNPWALRDVAARLIEAADRGLWEKPGDLRGALEQVYLDVEADLEGRGEQPATRRSQSMPGGLG
ncbi:MAG: cobaltochelatase subunit CobN [Chloroflexi bacterium]|nr:cobaltochelatase subunit CobN [Chloroflexota bacterium]